MAQRGQSELHGLYVALPFCRAKCSYCNFASGVFPLRRQEEYCRALIRELELTLAGLGGGRLLVDTMYWGGGTPTLLVPACLAALAEEIRVRVVVHPGAEFTVEAMPGTLDDEILGVLAAAGVNRVSLGVQSFHEAEARAVGRLHTQAAVLADLERLRRRGLANVNLDLIAGLPHQTLASWRASLAAAIDTGVPHISVYLLEIDEDSRLGREVLAGGGRYHAPAVPNDDLAAEAYEIACAELARAGLRQYEISNFARPGFESRHNERYWLRRPYLGLGLEAHSMAAVGGRMRRWGNHDGFEAYLAALAAGRLPRAEDSQVSDVGQRQEALFLGLRRNQGVQAAAAAGFEPEVEELEAAGLLAREAGRIALTPRGRLLANEVFVRFV